MTVLPYIVLVAGVATLLAVWCGWGLARLTLPVGLRPWTGLLAPLLGYALVLIVGRWLVRDLAGLPTVLLILLPATGALNAVAWWRTGPPRVPGVKQLGKHAPLGALLLVTFLVGVSPLLNYGYPAVIGRNWDVENYLPIARYLERGPVSAIGTSAPNPLRDLNAEPPTKGVTLGFPIWQGSVDVLTGSEAFTSFSIILSWLRMMGVMAVYVLFRAIMGLRRPFALLGAAFVSGSALLLWVSMFNFGMQMSAWPLIPLGLVMGVAAVEHVAEHGFRGWAALLSGAVGLGALPVAYYPALTLFVPLALGLGLALLAQSSHRVRLVPASFALGISTALLVSPTIGEYFEGFDWRYEDKITTLGVFKYIPLTDILGLTPFDLQAQARPLPPVPIEATLAGVAMAALMLVGLLRGPCRMRWLGLVLGAVAYMAWLRWVQEYPYAWMKGGAYAAFPFAGLVAVGVQAIVTQLSTGNRQLLIAGRAAILALALSFLVMMGMSERQIVGESWARPRLYTNQMPDLLGMRKQIPAGSRVTVTSDPLIDTVTFGLVSYLLDHTTMLGAGQTGYSGPWSNGAPDEIGDFGLLSYQEDPALLGFAAADRVWQGGSFILYRRAANVAAHLRLERTLGEGESIQLWTGRESLSMDAGSHVGGESRRVELSLAAFSPGRVTIDGQSFDLPAGGATLTTAPFKTPRQMTIHNAGHAPVTVRSVTLRRGRGDDSAEVVPQPMTVLARASAVAGGTMVTTTITSLLPNAGPLVVALDIWDTPSGLHYGWYGVERPRTQAQSTFTFTLDLESGSMAAVGADGAALPMGASFQGLKAGEYGARLNVIAGTRLLATSDDVFAFQVESSGEISNVRVLPASVVATSADRPLVPLDVQVGEDVKLAGYALSASRFEPGEELSLTLWWHALKGQLDERSILFHLRDERGEKRAQADGPPAGGARPTSTWQAGELIIDKHTLKIPDDLPSGDYTLAVGMYQYPSLNLLPMSRSGGRLAGDVAIIPVRIAR